MELILNYFHNQIFSRYSFILYLELYFYNRKVILFQIKLLTFKLMFVILDLQGGNLVWTTILKGYQFRLYPSDEQKKLINQTIGCSRFVYNHF